MLRFAVLLEKKFPTTLQEILESRYLKLGAAVVGVYFFWKNVSLIKNW